jgi:hypothetical protein
VDLRVVDNSTEDQTSWKDAWPKCDDIWQVGKTLPADYEEGCLSENDSVVDLSFTPCFPDGRTRLFVHSSPFGGKSHVAITGAAIQAYTEETYSKVRNTCANG